MFICIPYNMYVLFMCLCLCILLFKGTTNTIYAYVTWAAGASSSTIGAMRSEAGSGALLSLSYTILYYTILYYTTLYYTIQTMPYYNTLNYNSLSYDMLSLSSSTSSKSLPRMCSADTFWL